MPDEEAEAAPPEPEVIINIPLGTSFKVEERGYWYEAKVVQKRPGEVKVHYKGFKKTADEWIAESSKRLRLPKRCKKLVKPPPPPKAAATPEAAASVAAGEGAEPALEREPAAAEEEEDEKEEEVEEEEEAVPVDVSIGAAVLCFQGGQSYRAVVKNIEDRASGRQALVHYYGWNKRFDEWVPLNSHRIKLPSPHRSPRNHASSAAADAVATASPHDPSPMAGSAAVAMEGLGKRKAREAALPEGWATAAAAETLREFGERKFFAADWFTAFSAHAITKRSGESPEQLLARFVVSLNDLQMVGLCSASKRPRGSIEKRTFG